MAADEESTGLDDTFQLIKVQVMAVWRYRWLMLILAILVSLVGWPVVMQVPDEYRATTRLYVDTQSMLKPVLKGLAVQSDMAIEIADLTKRTLLTRNNIQRVIREADLDISVKNAKEQEKLINALQNNIIIASHGKDKRSTQHTFYSITYDHQKPETAYAVVKSVLDIFIENSMGETRKDSTLTEKFLQQQIEEYETRLLKAEENLKVFKQQNINFVSGQTGGYFNQFADAKEKLRVAHLQLRESQEKSRRLQEEIDKVVNGVGEYENIQITSPYDVRISKLTQQLDDLRLQYTDQHPNIIALRDTIKQLEEEKAKNIESSDKRASEGELANNKLYQDLTVALGTSNAEVSALTVRVKEYEEQVKRLEKLIDTIPDVEAKLAQLDRDYEINKEKYNSLVSRRESASISKQAETSSDQVIYKIIEAPKVPVIPEGPDRLLLLSAVYAVSLGAGIAIAWLLSQLKPTVMDSRSLTEKFGHRVIGVVSVVMSDKQRSYEKRKLFVFFAVLAIHFFIFAVLAASQFLYDDPLALFKEII